MPQDTTNLSDDEENLLLIRELIRASQIDNTDTASKREFENIMMQIRSTVKVKKVIKAKNKKNKKGRP